MIPAAVGFSQLERYGRLGNQAFQIAAAVGIARRHDLPVSLPSRWSYRPFLSCPDEWFAPARRVTDFYKFDDCAHIDERARPYGQDPALFRDVADEIRAAFDLSERGEELVYDASDLPRYDYLNAPDNSIALHVRRGDLLTQTQGFQPALTVDAPYYYRRALDVIDPMDVCPTFVFSDDADWCSENMGRIAGREMTVVQTAPPRSHIPSQYRRQLPLDLIDLHLFGRSNNLILSNSTFAWWGAWLAGFTDNVLYPSLWFGPNLDYIDTGLLTPPEFGWREVPCD